MGGLDGAKGNAAFPKSALWLLKIRTAVSPVMHDIEGDKAIPRVRLGSEVLG